jgi:hypothetical protein
LTLRVAVSAVFFTVVRVALALLTVVLAWAARSSVAYWLRIRVTRSLPRPARSS